MYASYVKQVVPAVGCQGGVSPYLVMLHKIKHVPPSILANQIDYYNQY